MRSLTGYLVVILVFISQANSVKVNVEGSVSLGKDVINVLSQYLGNIFISGRRSLNPVSEDSNAVIVRTASLCRNLAFCEKLNNFVEEFLTVLAMSVKTVIKETLKEKFNNIVFEQELKHYLDVTRNILEYANSEETVHKEIYYWMDTIKKICAKFQEMSLLVAIDEQANTKEVSNIRETVNWKLIIATALVEMKYQTKLCAEYYICIKSYEVTQSLNTLLKRLKTSEDIKVRLIIRYFYEALFETSFYEHVSEKIGHELQVILNDMAYSNEVPVKNILSTVEKIVEARIENIETNKELIMPHDAMLMQVILSDMDHVYSVLKSDTFKQFFQHFYNWFGEDVAFKRVISQTVKGINDELKTVSDDMLVKLINEVRAFLEITVEPDNESS